MSEDKVPFFIEQIHPESHQIREVYAAYGLCMFMCQAIETDLALLIAGVYGPGPRKITKSQFDELLQSYQEKTMGQVIRDLKKTPISVELLTELENSVLKKRNWLAHSYFWYRAGHFNSDAGRQFMLDELRELTARFELINEKTTAICQEYRKSLGITDEIFESIQQQLQQEVNALFNKKD